MFLPFNREENKIKSYDTTQKKKNDAIFHLHYFHAFCVGDTEESNDISQEKDEFNFFAAAALWTPLRREVQRRQLLQVQVPAGLQSCW